MRELLVSGIGLGSPDHLTLQAIEALDKVDVFFLIDKGDATRELVALRTDIRARHIDGDGYRIVEIPDVDRDRTSPVDRTAVVTWHEQRAVRCGAINELGEDGYGDLLVWGDPVQYDSTIRIPESIRQRGGLHFDDRVIQGISRVRALTGGHRMPTILPEDRSARRGTPGCARHPDRGLFRVISNGGRRRARSGHFRSGHPDRRCHRQQGGFRAAHSRVAPLGRSHRHAGARSPAP